MNRALRCTQFSWSPTSSDPLMFDWMALTRAFVFQALAVLLVLFVSGCGGNSSSSSPPPVTPPPTGTPSVTLSTLVSGLSSPLDFQAPDDNSGRIFIVQPAGTIRIINIAALLPTAFLGITSKLNFDGQE